jgi:hypothetical protein
MGNYASLSLLPDKLARFLYEIHVFRFESPDLPPELADRSDFDLHGALGDAHLPKLLVSIEFMVCVD